LVKRWTNEELLLPGQVVDAALMAALCSEEGDTEDPEPKDHGHAQHSVCYLGAH